MLEMILIAVVIAFIVYVAATIVGGRSDRR